MLKSNFIKLIQTRISNTSVSSSSARGIGPRGTIKAARHFLKNLNVRRFCKPNTKSFQTVLDKVTEELRTTLPRGAQYWGSSRKLLNIFLRGIVYNRYLCNYYRLKNIEKWLEIPLDSHVAKGLRLEKYGDVLPRWTTVIGLEPETSYIYQTVALNIAKLKKISRIHLDLLYWRADNNPAD